MGERGDQATLDPALREPAAYVLNPTWQPDFRNYCQYLSGAFWIPAVFRTLLGIDNVM